MKVHWSVVAYGMSPVRVVPTHLPHVSGAESPLIYFHKVREVPKFSENCVKVDEVGQVCCYSG